MNKRTVLNHIEVKRQISSLSTANLVKMASVDVVDMDSSIPKDMGITCAELFQENAQTPIEAHEIIHLLQFCLQNNLFQFEDEIFKESKGLATSSFLSPGTWIGIPLRKFITDRLKRIYDKSII